MNHRLLFHSAVAVATLLAAPASAGLLKGPYIQMLGKTGVTIVWETHGNASGTVEWGADSSLGTSVAAAAGTMHEVRIDGLSQDWSGALPALFLYDGRGELALFHEGRIEPKDLEALVLHLLDRHSGPRVE